MSVMLICEPKPGREAQRVLARRRRRPATALRSPSSGSGSLKFATGGTRPVSSALIATTSSMPAPIAWPVKPFVFAMTISSAAAPNAWRSALISAEALPPRAGV